MQEELLPPLLVLDSEVPQRKKKRRSSFRYSSKKQLLRARMIRRLSRISTADLSSSTRNLTYGDISPCEAIGEDIVEVGCTSCEAQPEIVCSYSDCDEHIDEEEENEDRGEGHQQQQHQHFLLPTLELEMELEVTNRMVRK